MFLIQFPFPRLSVLINSRKNYFRSLTQNSILSQFIWLQINLPEDKCFNQLPSQIWNKRRGTGIGRQPFSIKSQTWLPCFSWGNSDSFQGLHKDLRENSSSYALGWNQGRLLKKIFFFQAKQSVSDVAMQEPVWTAPHYEISPSLVSTAPSVAPASGS